MLQLLDLARENAALKGELVRLGDEMTALHRFFAAGSDKGKENVMPRITQLAPDGSGRYIASIGMGSSGAARRSARRRAARSTSSESRCPRSSRGTTDEQLAEYLN
jgi:hypothetical protein